MTQRRVQGVARIQAAAVMDGAAQEDEIAVDAVAVGLYDSAHSFEYRSTQSGKVVSHQALVPEVSRRTLEAVVEELERERHVEGGSVGGLRGELQTRVVGGQVALGFGAGGQSR
jgi:hypothetical protein